MRRHLLICAAVLALAAATPGAGGPAAGQAAPASQQPPPTFRTGADLIPVDVQVIDRDGRPIAGLGPDKFEVTINGRRRRVVTAAYVDSRATTVPSSPAAAAAPGDAAAASAPVPAPGRIIILAVDCISFNAGVARTAMTAARDFIKRLPASDQVGLFAYPSGPMIDPTLDHAAIDRALDQVVGQQDSSATTQFNLRPSEIIDLNAEFGALNDLTGDVAKRLCGPDLETSCVRRLILDISTTALFYEGQANASVGMLRSLLSEMARVSGRKTLVLVSGGMLASDRPGGRPDLNDIGLQVGKEAARANTAIYTLQIDSSYRDQFSAETRNAAASQSNMARDGEVLGRWLDQFSGAAGGALFKVVVGNGEYAYNRILTEISSYYLLGVEPAEADRDGRTHEIKVKVSQKSATVRGRKWVAVPKRGETVVADAAAAPVPSAAAPSSTAAAVRPPRPLPADVQPLVDAFEQGDYAAVQNKLDQANDLANLIRGFRAADAPWPDAPHRAAVFALEMAVAGLRSDNSYARDEGARLLAEYNTRVRQPLGADVFECAWLWSQTAALEGLLRPSLATLFITHSLQRCPSEPRLVLARALVAEQQWLGAPAITDTVDVTGRYEEAMKFPDTAAEARVRAAWFLQRAGQSDRALELLDGVTGPVPDRYVTYLAGLVRCEVLRARGRFDDAMAACRAALTTWPGAQSARVTLMTLLVSHGDRQEAAALADAVETAPDDAVDPWWTYWLGDSRVYPAIVTGLRELAR